MTLLEKLEMIRDQFQKIERKKGMIEYYEMMSNALGGCDFQTERIDKTRNLDAPFVKWIYKKIDAEKELKDLQANLNIQIDEVGKILANLQNKDYSFVLTLKYCYNFSWSEIAEKMNYSVSSVRRFYKNAVEEAKTMEVEQA